MAIKDLVMRSGRALAVATAVIATVAFAAPTPAEARVSTGAAIGIGLGSFALGTAVGSAYARPYGYYPYGGYYAAPPPAPAYYYPPAPAYYAPARSCWDPYYQRYYGC